MRLILFFDLPVGTSSERRKAQRFVKDIKEIGFYMMQESVYIKLTTDAQASKSCLDKVKHLVPDKGNVAVLSITEKQFSEINYILGDCPSCVVDSDERVIEI